jgi:hypothetical protein
MNSSVILASLIPSFCIYRLVTDIPDGGGVSRGKQCQWPHECRVIICYNLPMSTELTNYIYICIFSHLPVWVGTEVVAYEGPRPTAGIHRFAFVVFRQTVQQAIYAPGWRANFNTRDLAECYGLGAPVAAAYFNCQREGSCGGRRYRWMANKRRWEITCAFHQNIYVKKSQISWYRAS